MTFIPVRIIPDPVLRQKAQSVATVDARIAGLLDDMTESMYRSKGIGLAANQVGLLERLITVDISEERTGSQVFQMVNPEIVWSDPEATFTYNEGCLSIPEQYADVTRPKRVRISYLDRAGARRELEAEDLFSQCIQHEIDHLNGVLFIDRISKIKRDMIVRRVDKAQRLKDQDAEHTL